MVEMDAGDINRDIVNTIMLYKGEPVYVTKVDLDLNVTFKVMRTQKTDIKPFSFETFAPPNARLGMVNSHGFAYFLSRIPYRKMVIGYSLANVSFNHYYDDTWDNEQFMKGLHTVKKISGKEVANTLLGEFPPFAAALKAVSDKEKGGCMAFDRQFAVTDKRHIIYKNKKVGVIPKVKTRVEHIIWDAGYEHLSILIGENCAQTLRNLRQA